MAKSIISVLAVCLVLLAFAGRRYSQETENRSLRLMFYNVENLFDTSDDSLRGDNDFLPGGAMNWNYSRYMRKIHALYKTIIAAGSWSPPEIISFCEVENRKVLEDLIYGTYLAKFDYQIIHEDSPDQRGIDVCLIYRAERLSLIDFRYWIPAGVRKEDFVTRSVLCARFRHKTDTLHLILNHWPSRRGGVLAGEGLRGEIAGMVREKADSISRKYSSGARIIIAGDFNCTPDDKVMRTLVRQTCSDICLTNLSEGLAAKGIGTYRYMGAWEMIDQVIVSRSLISSENGLFTSTGMLKVFSPDFLLKKDPKFPGMSPWSTYRGYRYQGGFSDHLPVLLDLGFR